MRVLGTIGQELSGAAIPGNSQAPEGVNVAAIVAFVGYVAELFERAVRGDCALTAPVSNAKLFERTIRGSPALWHSDTPVRPRVLHLPSSVHWRILCGRGQAGHSVKPHHGH